MPGLDACYHCGLPNPARSEYRAVIAGTERSFCCGGCQAVAQMLHSAGLADFYVRRTANAPRSRERTASPTEWDDAATQARVVRRDSDGRCEISLLLDGIQCSACAWLIETWLQRQSGVVRASVNYATRRANVAWDPRATRLSALLDAVQAIGYAAYPYDPARREALTRHEARTLLTRTAIAVFAMMQVMMFALPTYVSIDGVESLHRRLLEWASLTLTLPALLYCAAPFFRGAWRDAASHRAGMDVPVALGLAAAFAASAWSTLTGSGAVYYDSITMFIALLLAARYVELVTRRRAGDAVEAIARARPATAERLPGWPTASEAVRVVASSLAPDDIVLVRAGSVVPADGVVIDGRASVEEALLTGEPAPRGKTVGHDLLAGSIARDGALVMRVTAAGDATRLAGIERLVERASGERPGAARLADRVAQHFVMGLLGVALVSAIAWSFVDSTQVLTVVFGVLAISCPCALSLATPAAIAAGHGALSKRGVVVTRPDAIETLARVTHVVFDKTGTLTRGDMRLIATRSFRAMHEREVIALATALESTSEHPIACALRHAAGTTSLPPVIDVRVHAGLGVEGMVAGKRVRVGSPGFVAALGGNSAACHDMGSATQVALGDVDGLIAVFAIGDALREEARALVSDVASLGVATMLLSGDGQQAVDAVAAKVGIAHARGNASPEDKREAIAALQAQGAVVAMIGDGINDAPALARADVSISLASATPLAQWTADVVVLADDLAHVHAALTQARRTMGIVRQNLAWAFAYNALAVPAAAFGLVTPLVAAIGMSASSMLVVLNAARAGRCRRAAPPTSRRDEVLAPAVLEPRAT